MEKRKNELVSCEEINDQQGSLSRRGFLAGSGFLAGGALVGNFLTACTPQAKDADTGVQQAKGHVNHVSDICSGCRTCELTCSIYHEGVINPQLARNSVRKNIRVGHITDVYYCQQCDDPKCYHACPNGAIYIDEATGARVIDQEKCLGCQTCLQACIYYPQTSRIKYNPTLNKCFKCDLCGGDPQCVKLCPLGASQLSWESYTITKPGDDYVAHAVEGALEVEFEKQFTGHYANHIIMRQWALLENDAGVEVQGSWDSGEGSTLRVTLRCEFMDAEGKLLGQSDEHVYKSDLHTIIDVVHPFIIDDPSLIKKVVLVGEVTNWRNGIDEER